MKRKFSNRRIRKKPPRSVVLVTWLMLLQSIGMLSVGILYILTGVYAFSFFDFIFRFAQIEIFNIWVSSTILVLLGLAGLIITISLTRLAPRAWLGAMTVQGLIMLVYILEYLQHRPNYIGMLVGVVLVLGLNQQEVRAAFSLQHSSTQQEV